MVPAPPAIVGVARLPVGRPRAWIRYMAGRNLIVDDSPGFRAAAAELLAARGLRCSGAAADGKQGACRGSRRVPGRDTPGHQPSGIGWVCGGGVAGHCLLRGQDRTDVCRCRPGSGPGPAGLRRGCVRSQTGAGCRRPQDTVLRLAEADSRPAELPGGGDRGRPVRKVPSISTVPTAQPSPARGVVARRLARGDSSVLTSTRKNSSSSPGAGSAANRP